MPRSKAAISSRSRSRTAEPPGALAAGQIDAATLIHSQAFRAMKSGVFRPIAETGRDNIRGIRHAIH